MNHKHEALWPFKNYKLYALSTLILSNLLHLIIGSKCHGHEKLQEQELNQRHSKENKSQEIQV